MHKAIYLSITLALASCSCTERKSPEQGHVTQAKADPSPATHRSNSEQPIDSKELPPHGATLSQAVPELRRRIAQGDAVASCQLAREFDFCDGAEVHARYMQSFASHRKASSTLDSNATDNGSILTDLANVRAEYCAGLSTVLPAERLSLWRQAAQRGHVASMLQYGTGLAFRFDRTLAALDELRVYKSEGPKLVERVARAGSFQANLMLARAYAPQLNGPNRTPLLRQAVVQEAPLSLAYYKLAMDLHPGSGFSSPTNLGLETEMTSLAWSMSGDELAESERRYQILRRDLSVNDRAMVDIEALDSIDVGQPVPSTQLCADGGILR